MIAAWLRNVHERAPLARAEAEQCRPRGQNLVHHSGLGRLARPKGTAPSLTCAKPAKSSWRAARISHTSSSILKFESYQATSWSL